MESMEPCTRNLEGESQKQSGEYGRVCKGEDSNRDNNTYHPPDGFLSTVRTTHVFQSCMRQNNVISWYGGCYGWKKKNFFFFLPGLKAILTLATEQQGN